MKAFATIEEARCRFIDHIEVLFPIPETDILVLYRDVFGLYRIAYANRDGKLPTRCDEIVEYAESENTESMKNEQA